MRLQLADEEITIDLDALQGLWNAEQYLKLTEQTTQLNRIYRQHHRGAASTVDVSSGDLQAALSGAACGDTTALAQANAFQCREKITTLPA
jgi:hypothetical protein